MSETPSDLPGTHRSVQTGDIVKTPLLGHRAWLALGFLLIALALCITIAWQTKDSMSNLPFLHLKSSTAQSSRTQQTLVDQTAWKTAVSLAALATTQEELAYARRAEHLADQDVDQAFAVAFRVAALKQRVLTGDALSLQAKMTQLETTTAADQQVVTQATLKGGDDLEVAQAQLGLDQDELNDAKGDFARASGDQRAQIQQELVAHQADEKKYDASAGTGDAAVAVVRRYGTLARFVAAWHRQNERSALLLEAQSAAQHTVNALIGQHNSMEQSANRQQADTYQQAQQRAEDRIAGLKRLSLQRQLMAAYDDRISTETQLAEVYGKWLAQVALQHRIVAHLVAVQCTYILLILLVAIIASAVVHFVAEREILDRRRIHTLSRILRLCVQVLAFIAVLLVVFGPPQQLSTVIGLTTAGLTVALQDFILGFVGWFLLMGRSGLGVGDIVEINAVTGQVVDIGVFRTTLLETGNWTAKGHPTGRRVAFNNKFAISGQFFNFSTVGQWMWDEITVNLPTGGDARAITDRVHQVVTNETEDDAHRAESEWSASSLQRGLSRFSAEPEVNLRPSTAGFDLVIRYVTRASGRFDRRNKLYRCALEAVHQPDPAPQTAS